VRALLVVAVLVAAPIGALSACQRGPKAARPDAGAPASPKRLVLALTAEPDSLCPLVAESAVGQEAAALVARDVVANDPSWKTVPDLAAALPEVTTDPDGTMTAAWTLRSDARWEDGAPVTAKDVLFSWRLQTDPARQTVAGRDVAEKIQAIRATAGGFSVTWKEQNLFFAEVRTHRPVPAHVLEPLLLDDKKNLRPLKDHPYCKKPLSNGPFRLVEWAAGQHLLFSRNPHASPRPLLDEVLVRVLPSSTALMTALLAGEVDATFPNAGLSPVEAQRFVREHAPDFALVSTPGQVWTHIDVNLEDPILSDLRVREALALAIPRKQIFDAISGGLYEVSETYLPPLHWGHAVVEPIVHDPARAEQLLEAAGFSKQPDGARVRKDGARLRFTLHAASGLKESEELLLLVKDALAKVGVEIVLELEPFKVFNGALAKGRMTRQLSFYAWVFDGSTFGGSMWRTDRIPNDDNGWRGQNYPAYRNAEVTRLLDEVDRSVDAAVRKDKLGAVQRALRKDLPAIPMYFRPAVIVVRKGVTGLKPTGTLTPLAWNAAEWDVATASP
jgi:peptide/nickel transport system substrate-binding protein